MVRKGNPPWETDELILALDLYLRKGPNISSSDAELLEVSEALNALTIHEERGIYGTFRNANSVAMKLGNFASLDPSHEGKGLARGSAADRRVWERFRGSPEELAALASSIKDRAASNELPRTPEMGEEGSAEGRYVYRLHRLSERDPRMAKKKKELVKRTTGRLACEVCEIDFEETYGALGEGFIECHHLVPLSEGKERVTSLSDLALLCPNCHSMIHKTDPLETPDQLRSRFTS
jgi:5-methylcytosine-specific restriction protein A